MKISPIDLKQYRELLSDIPVNLPDVEVDWDEEPNGTLRHEDYILVPAGRSVEQIILRPGDVLVVLGAANEVKANELVAATVVVGRYGRIRKLRAYDSVISVHVWDDGTVDTMEMHDRISIVDVYGYGRIGDIHLSGSVAPTIRAHDHARIGEIVLEYPRVEISPRARVDRIRVGNVADIIP